MFSSSVKAAGVSPPSRSTVCRLAVGAVIGLLCVFGFALPVYAQEEAPPSAVSSLEPKTPLANFNGAYRETVKIEIPAFRGLEPDLALSYSSARTGLYPGQPASGWLGVGWTLSGIDVIERAVRGRGSPSFNDQDIFLLDGEEMIACGTRVISPSCATGGTHATRVESYRRIKRDALGNTWEITDRDGTRHVYRSIGEGQSVGSDPNEVKLAFEYRWLLRSSIDTHGNEVTYSWTCQTLPDCRPATIIYNGTTVRYLWEPRPDQATYATGLSIGTMSHRLKAIDVSVGPQRLRAYALTYDISPVTQRSRLTSVQEFGSDAVVEETGAITSGTALSATLIDYSGSTSIPTAGQKASRTFEFGDVNGDQKDDLARLHGESYPYIDEGGEGGIKSIVSGNRVPCQSDVVQINNNTMGSTENWPVKNCPEIAPGNGVNTSVVYVNALSVNRFLGDFDGDGREDFAVLCCATTWGQSDTDGNYFQRGVDGSLLVFLSRKNSAGGNEFVYSWRVGIDNVTDQYSFLATSFKSGDFNGDGKTDLLYGVGQFGNPFINESTILSSTGSGFTKLSLPTWSAGGRTRTEIGDFNGDGKTDIIYLRYQNSNEIKYSMLLSTGSGFIEAAPRSINSPYFTFSTPCGSDSFSTYCTNYAENLTIADANGDGRSDLVRIRASTGPRASSLVVEAHLSTGSTLASQTWFNDLPIKKAINESGELRGQLGFFIVPGDFNNDNQVDIALGDYHEQNRLNVRTLLSEPGRYARGPDIPSAAAKGEGVDLNGDAKTDLVITEGTSVRPYFSESAGVDLVKSVRNTHGGITVASYAPSSRWVNSNMPFIVQTSTSVTKDDGRGQKAETKFTYKGGLWNAVERQFLGFRSSQVTLPCIEGEVVCPTVDITFSQNLASLGRAHRVQYLGTGGKILREILHYYDVNNTTAPFTAINTQSIVTDYSGGGVEPGPDPIPQPGNGDLKILTFAVPGAHTFTVPTYSELTVEVFGGGGGGGPRLLNEIGEGGTLSGWIKTGTSWNVFASGGNGGSVKTQGIGGGASGGDVNLAGESAKAEIGGNCLGPGGGEGGTDSAKNGASPGGGGAGFRKYAWGGGGGGYARKTYRVGELVPGTKVALIVGKGGLNASPGAGGKAGDGMVKISWK